MDKKSMLIGAVICLAIALVAWLIGWQVYLAGTLISALILIIRDPEWLDGLKESPGVFLATSIMWPFSLLYFLAIGCSALLERLASAVK